MPKRKQTKKRPPGSSLTLFLLGFLFILVSVLWNIYQTRVLSFNQAPAQIVIPKEVENPKAPPSRIMIRKLGLNLPITQSRIINGVWEINPKGGSHLLGSANPGENGNMILYGHNNKTLFGGVLALKINDQIKVISEDENEYTYQVVETKTVNPADIYVLAPTPDETLTFFTCVGILDSQRFVVVAKPLVF